MMLSTRRDVAARRGFLVGLTPHNRLASGRTQHGQELVGSAEAARLQSRRRTLQASQSDRRSGRPRWMYSKPERVIAWTRPLRNSKGTALAGRTFNPTSTVAAVSFQSGRHGDKTRNARTHHQLQLPASWNRSSHLPARGATRHESKGQLCRKRMVAALRLGAVGCRTLQEPPQGRAGQ